MLSLAESYTTFTVSHLTYLHSVGLTDFWVQLLSAAFTLAGQVLILFQAIQSISIHVVLVFP